MSRISYLPPLTGAMSPIYGGEGARMYAARDREWRRRGLDSAGRPLIMAPNVLPAGPPRGPPTPGGSLEEAQKNLLAKQQARERLAEPYEPGVTPEGRMSFGSGGPPARGGTVGDAGDLAGGPWTEMTPVPVTDEEQANVEANPAYQRLDQQAMPGAPAMAPGQWAARPEIAEARRQLLRSARTGNLGPKVLGLTDYEQAEKSGVPQSTLNYAERVGKSHVATRKAGEDRAMARNLRMRGPGPMLMRMMQGPEGVGAGGQEPKMLPLGLARNPKEAELVNQHNRSVMEYEASKGRTEAELAQIGAKKNEGLDLAWSQGYATQRAALDQAYPDNSPSMIQWKDKEARRQAGIAVPNATQARAAEAQVPNAQLSGGGTPATQEHAALIRNHPRKEQGGDLYDFILLHPEGTPPETLKAALRDKGWTDQDIKVALEEPQTNLGTVFGSSGMNRQIKAVERLAGKKIGATQKGVAHALQGLPLVGPMASGIAGEVVPGSFWFD